MLTKGDKIIAGTGTITPLLTSIWSDHILNDISWLRADTFSWQSGDVYTSVYNKLVEEWNDWFTNHTWADDHEEECGVHFARTKNNFKITTEASEQAVLNAYNSTGVAWFYVLDTENRRFKLPRTKFGFTGLRDRAGNDVKPGLPDHNHTVTTDIRWGTRAPIDSLPHWCGDDGRGATNISLTSSNASESNSIYGNSNTVQPPATQMYLYFYVGQFTQTATEQTAGLNAELFNGKADLDRLGHIVIEFQEPTEANGYTWYRKYADGWVEQGGYHSGTQDQQITLPVAMLDNKYTITLSAQSFGSNYNGCIINIRSDTQTNTGFKIQTRDYNNGNYARDGYWQVSGKSKQN